jgi:uncharacterized membrane protein
MLRLPSAIAGVLSLGAIYLLGRRLYGPREGLLSAAIMAVGATAIYYSQEARPYALVMLFAILSTYVWMNLARRRDLGLDLETASYVVLAIIGLYLHYYAGLLVALQALHLLVLALVTRRRVLPVILLYLPAGLAYLPWMPTLYETFVRPTTFGTAWIRPRGVTYFVGYLSFIFDQYLRYVVLLLWGAYLAWRAFRLWRQRDALSGETLASPDAVVLVWLLGPFAVAFAVSQLFRPMLFHRYLLVSMPAAILLLARSLVALPDLLRRPLSRWAGHLPRWATLMPAVAVVAYMAVALLFITDYYGTHTKTEFRQATEYVLSRQAADQEALIIGYSGPNRRYEDNLFDYYFQQHGAPGVDVVAGQPEDRAHVAALIESRQPPVTWYLHAFMEPDETFLQFLQSHYQEMEVEPFHEITVYRFSQPVDGAQTAGAP